MKTAYLFPGQGAQYPGMGKDLWQTSDKVKELFQLGSDATGMNLTRVVFEGTEEELRQTDVQQVAITAASLAAATVLEEKGIAADAVAGFSLGEFAALCTAGVLTQEDTLRTVKARGEIFARVSNKLATGEGGPGMAAVVGLSLEQVTEVLNGIEDAFVANYNSPTQIAISGTGSGLEAAEAPLKEAGARRYIRLKVSGPFHSPLLEEARREFGEFLQDLSFAEPRVPVYANVTGTRTKTGSQAKELCIRQVVSTVLWVHEEKSLVQDGIDRFLEVGPGAVLTGLMKRFDDTKQCLPAGTIDQINAIAEG
jgi:[acyl-carrier-protein] S-malonyltransferase